MKILVAIKRVPDPNATIKVAPDGNGIVTDNLKYVVNPFCEIAIEEALQIKEKQGGAEVVLVSIGGQVSQEQLRTGLAMGADRAILVLDEGEVEPVVVARVLQKLVEQESPDLVLMGKQAIDDDSNVVGQMLAEMLGWGQGTFASEVKLADDKSSAVVTREVDGGLEDVEVQLPAIITARPSPERAPLRVSSGHHEGPQEGVEGDPLGRPRRRSRRADQGAQDCSTSRASGR